MGDAEMNVDKGMAFPEWEGNECLLTLPDVTTQMICCVWKTKSFMTMNEFQGVSCVRSSPKLP
jgi:hypothetical protein